MAEEVSRWAAAAAQDAEPQATAAPPPPSHHHHHHQVTRIFQNALTGITSPAEAAKRLECAVTSHQGSAAVRHAYDLVIARVLSAAESLGDDLAHRRLAALVAALACLPDARNSGDGIVSGDGGARGEGQAALGEAVACGGERLWGGLPGLFGGLVCVWEGQEACTPSERKMLGLSDEEVRDRWANVNAFCAYLIQLSTGQAGALACDALAIWTLRRALEEDGVLGTGAPVEPDIHLPAAAYWVHILGSEMRYWTKVFHGTEKRMVRGGVFYDADKHGYRFSPTK